MSFTWFKKHEKTFLWITVAFTIVIFALFSTMGDVERAFSDKPAPESVAGSFTVQTTGETRDVEHQELLSVRRSYSRFTKMMSRSGSSAEVTDEDIWALVINVADAEGAGLVVSDSEISAALSTMMGGDLALYEQIVLGSGFPSLARFEDFFKKFMLQLRWQEAQMRAASVLPAEDVYSRWRVDHELFDLDVVTFADRDPLSIPSPGDGALREYYDELPEFRRSSLFVESARHDIAFAFVPLDVDADAFVAELDETVAAKISEPTDAELQQRFVRVKSQRYEDIDALDDELRAVLRNELMMLSLAAQAHQAFRLQTEEERSPESFQAIMESHGMAFVDPEGMLGPDEVETLDPIGDSILPLRLKQMRKAGDSQTLTSVTGKETAAAVVYLQDLVEERELTYDEAREGDEDMVLAEWRKSQVDQAARDFRDLLREDTLLLPEVAAITGPLETGATEAAETTIAEAEAAADAGPGAPPVDDERREQIRATELGLVQGEIDAAVAENEHLAWEAVLTKIGNVVERISYTDVPRNYRAILTADERDPASLEQFVKSHYSVFQLDVDGITGVQRLPVAKISFVVRVSDRRFPDMADMFADEEGMLAARQIQIGEARALLSGDFLPAAVTQSHDLQIVAPIESEAELREDEIGEVLEDEVPADL